MMRQLRTAGFLLLRGTDTKAEIAKRRRGVESVFARWVARGLAAPCVPKDTVRFEVAYCVEPLPAEGD